jgi:hypothetical protein
VRPSKRRAMGPNDVPTFGIGIRAVLAGQPSLGNDSNKVLGTWTPVPYETEVHATGQKEPALGQSPTRNVAFNYKGCVLLVLTGDARKPAKTSEQREQLIGAPPFAYRAWAAVSGTGPQCATSIFSPSPSDRLLSLKRVHVSPSRRISAISNV